jgi:glycosyltransferase involved in cell wall biosynthesis
MLPSKFHGKATTVYNIFNPRIDSFVERNFSGILKFISVGGISPYKGFEIALLAISQLEDDTRKRLKYTVVGGVKNAGYFQELQELVKKHSLEQIVTFTGYIDDVYPLLLESDIMIVPSFHEGLCRAILEAYDASLPVLGTRVGGIPELIDDGVTGWLFAAGDTKGLEEKLRNLIADPDLCLQLSRNTQQKLQSFTRFKSKDKIMDLIEAM